MWLEKHWKPLPSGDQTWLAGKYSINGCFSGNIIYKLEIFNGHVWFTRGYLLLVRCMNTCERPIFISIIYIYLRDKYMVCLQHKKQPWSNRWRFHIFHVLWCQISQTIWWCSGNVSSYQFSWGKTMVRLKHTNMRGWFIYGGSHNMFWVQISPAQSQPHGWYGIRIQP